MKTYTLSLIALFAASGVLYAQQAPSSSTPTDQQEEAPVQLDPFEVSADNNVGYGANALQSSSKLAQSYLDVAQTVNVITAEFMSDEQAFDTVHMLDYMPNVQASNYAVIGLYEIRGVGLYSTGQLEAIYVDGVQDAGGNWGYFLPTEFYDRVELVKGPSSAAFGVGEPSGMLNYISKVPQGVERTDVTVSVGDYDNWRLLLDSQGFVRGDKTLTYRINLVDEQGDYAQQNYFHSAQGGQISLKWQPSESNAATLIVYGVKNLEPGYWPSSAVSNTTVAENSGFLQAPGGPAVAATLPALVSPEETVGPPGNNYDEATDWRVELKLDHAFNEHIHLQDITSIDDLYEVYLQQLPSIGYQGPSIGWASLNLALDYHFPDNRQTNALDAIFDYDTPYGHYKTLVGGIIYSNKYESNRDIGFPEEESNPSSYRFESIYNPSQVPLYVPSVPNGTGGNAGGWIYNNVDESYNEKGYGFDVTEMASWFNDRITLDGGIRKDFFREVERFYESGYYNDSGWEHTAIVPRVALTIKPDQHFAVYGMVTEHKDPPQTLSQPAPAQTTAALTAALQALGYSFGRAIPFTPDETQEEFGIKSMWLNGALTFTACVFHIDYFGAASSRVIQFYDAHPPQTAAFGEAAAPGTTFGQPGNYLYVIPVVIGENLHGEEISMFGVLSRRLTFQSDFAATRGYYPNPDSATGAMSSIAPPISLDFHGKYDFGDLHGNGFYVTGGGTYYFGGWMYDEAFNNYQGLEWNSAQYVVNLGIGYRWDNGRQTIYVNDDNITNRAVIASNSDSSSEYLPLQQGFITYKYSF